MLIVRDLIANQAELKLLQGFVDVFELLQEAGSQKQGTHYGGEISKKQGQRGLKSKALNLMPYLLVSDSEDQSG